VLTRKDAVDLHPKRHPVLAFTRRPDAREHLSTVAALPVLLIAACLSTDPSMLSKEPAPEDTPNGHARHNLLHRLSSLYERLAHPPFVLLHPEPAKLGERVRLRLVKCPFARMHGLVRRRGRTIPAVTPWRWVLLMIGVGLIAAFIVWVLLMLAFHGSGFE
jgi:hypothetical protein